MRQLVNVILVVAGGYLLLLLLVYGMQDRFLYFPTHDKGATPRDLNLDYEDVTLTTEDGVKLHGWFVPAPNARGTVLHFHGNAGNITHRLQRIALFRRMGMNVFLFDYRGYGDSTGRPSQEGTYKDARAAWRYLTQERKLPPSSIIVHGESLGAAVASWLAAQETPGGVILESGFTSAADLGAELYTWIPVRWLMRNPYPSSANLPNVHAPVLIVHSRSDEIIPFRHGEALYAAANEPKRLLKIRGGHNDGFMITGESYIVGVKGFVDTVLPKTEPRLAKAKNRQKRTH